MEKNKIKKNNKKDIFAIIIFIFVIIGIAMLFMNKSSNIEELHMNDFVKLVETDKVKTITASPAGSGANEKLYTIVGQYVTNDGKEAGFTVTITDDVFNTKIADNTVYKGKLVIKKVSTTNWFSIISFLILPVILVIVMIMIFKNSAGGNSKAFDFAKSRAKLNKKTEKITFKDVAGAKEEKEEMQEVIDFLKTPKKYFEIGARIPKGILLVGPPGTGKTLLAKAVAGEASVPFFSISGSDFVEMFVGVGASRVRDMFKKAKTNAPCIIFIDEIDAVGRQRGAGLGGGHDEREQTLNQLLVEMDGFGENSGVIVMAATNRPDVLDPALLRPGRFDRRITMSNPDFLARVEILKVHARNKKISKKIKFEDIARRTPGFSGADIENLLNESALLAARENRKEVKIYDIDEAIDRVIMGPAKKSRRYSPEEKKAVSYHETGHAIIGVKLANAETVQKVTIVPRGMAGGYSMSTPDKEKFMHTYQDLVDTITGLLGGRVSEELFIGDISTGAQNDIERATKIARSMVAEYGMSKLGPIQYEKQTGSVFLGRDYMSDKNFSDQVALEIDIEVRAIISQCYEKAKKVLKENEDLVKNVAKHLMDIETLTKEDIYELVETGKLAWWEKKKVKLEAEKVAKEKEKELQEVYKKQLEAMKKSTEEEKVEEKAEDSSSQEETK